MRQTKVEPSLRRTSHSTSRGKHRPGDFAQRLVAFAARVDHVARHADQLFRRVAEHVGELRVAQEEAALAREGDAERQVAEQRLVFELGVARAAGVGGARVGGVRRFRDEAQRFRIVHCAASLSKSSA
jgi:hypothetical protein